MDKIQHIKTHSADTISRFTNLQIQTIIDHFTEKPNMEFTDDPSDGLPEIKANTSYPAPKTYISCSNSDFSDDDDSDNDDDEANDMSVTYFDDEAEYYYNLDGGNL
ncbi:hypothetical protein Glove_137g152 [Diversispora epigaea]|uniref:Uncharacterized protein n=1 Tax=Diversispora epigaea TaxID=1348612 RepID=A0A397J544_9GLOM|nr:hypothetical protein Glove_137g152 [Diversispora epigaea]